MTEQGKRFVFECASCGRRHTVSLDACRVWGLPMCYCNSQPMIALHEAPDDDPEN